jgi:hypothetical protein
MKLPAAIVGSILAAGCASAGSTRPSDASVSPVARSTLVDDARIGDAPDHFSYVGHWEHVTGRHDGRLNGTSSRSWHAGDNIILSYVGSELRLYGVTGPNGGNAAIAIDGRYYGTANFYSQRLRTHALVFSVPALGEGVHTMGVLVAQTPGYPRRRYVNVDSVTVLHAR